MLSIKLNLLNDREREKEREVCLLINYINCTAKKLQTTKISFFPLFVDKLLVLYTCLFFFFFPYVAHYILLIYKNFFFSTFFSNFDSFFRLFICLFISWWDVRMFIWTHLFCHTHKSTNFVIFCYFC